MSRGRDLALLALRVALATAVLAGFAFFVRGLDVHALLVALQHASLPLVLAATAINFLQIFFKALRWRVMLAAARFPVPTLRLFRYTVTCYAVSTLLPARLGEVVRVWLLRERERVPARASTAVALGEKVLELLAMLVVVAPVPWLMPSLPRSVTLSIGGLAVLGVVLLAVGAVLAGRARAGSELHRFAVGLESMRRPGALGLALAASLGAWLTDLAIIVVVMRALGVTAPPATALLVLLGVNIAVAVPSTPASVGAFEIGALAALHFVHVPDEMALAVALVYHALQVVPMALIGVAELHLVRHVRAGVRIDEE